MDMYMTRVILRCPKCKQQFIGTRPDSKHPNWSYEKPHEDKMKNSWIEQVCECANPYCKHKFTVYWYEIPIQLAV